MLLVREKTEEKLYSELKKCWVEFPTQRCLFLRFSQLEDVSERDLEKCLSALKENLDDPTCQIYVCHDGDVFILTRYMTHKRTSELLSHLTPTMRVPLLGLASLFEIGVDWARLKTLCVKKIENLRLLESQKHKKKEQELDKVSSEKTLETIDGSLVKTIAERRQARSGVEVMAVEDDMFSQKLIGNALKNHYSLSISGDGQGAVMSYVNKAPDVLFLDIGLPDICGHDVLERIFKIDPEAYVVMFSGNGDKENIMRALELGAKGFVGKPFTREKLIQYINKSPFILAKQNKETNHGTSIH